MVGIIRIEGQEGGKLFFNPGRQVEANGKGEIFPIDDVFNLKKC